MNLLQLFIFKICPNHLFLHQCSLQLFADLFWRFFNSIIILLLFNLLLLFFNNPLKIYPLLLKLCAQKKVVFTYSALDLVKKKSIINILTIVSFGVSLIWGASDLHLRKFHDYSLLFCRLKLFFLFGFLDLNASCLVHLVYLVLISVDNTSIIYFGLNKSMYKIVSSVVPNSLTIELQRKWMFRLIKVSYSMPLMVSTTANISTYKAAPKILLVFAKRTFDFFLDVYFAHFTLQFKTWPKFGISCLWLIQHTELKPTDSSINLFKTLWTAR